MLPQGQRPIFYKFALTSIFNKIALTYVFYKFALSYVIYKFAFTSVATRPKAYILKFFKNLILSTF